MSRRHPCGRSGHRTVKALALSRRLVALALIGPRESIAAGHAAHQGRCRASGPVRGAAGTPGAPRGVARPAHPVPAGGPGPAAPRRAARPVLDARELRTRFGVSVQARQEAHRSERAGRAGEPMDSSPLCPGPGPAPRRQRESSRAPTCARSSTLTAAHTLTSSALSRSTSRRTGGMLPSLPAPPPARRSSATS